MLVVEELDSPEVDLSREDDDDDGRMETDHDLLSTYNVKLVEK